MHIVQLVELNIKWNKQINKLLSQKQNRYFLLKQKHKSTTISINFLSLINYNSDFFLSNKLSASPTAALMSLKIFFTAIDGGQAWRNFPSELNKYL